MTARQNSGASITFGAIEQVSIPALGIHKVTAKIDTGAYTGALHCVSIKRHTKPDGTAVLRFRPINAQHALQEVSDYQRVIVTSASGHRSRRYAVPVQMVINGRTYQTYIGLTSRADLKRQILIGRRFLRAHNIVVDVGKSHDQEDKIEVL